MSAIVWASDRGDRERTRQAFSQAETPLGQRKQHHAAVRRHAPTVERSCDFLALDGWNANSEIVSSVMPAVAGAKARTGLASAQKSSAIPAVYATAAKRAKPIRGPRLPQISKSWRLGVDKTETSGRP